MTAPNANLNAILLKDGWKTEEEKQDWMLRHSLIHNQVSQAQSLITLGSGLIGSNFNTTVAGNVSTLDYFTMLTPTLNSIPIGKVWRWTVWGTMSPGAGAGNFVVQLNVGGSALNGALMPTYGDPWSTTNYISGTWRMDGIVLNPNTGGFWYYNVRLSGNANHKTTPVVNDLFIHEVSGSLVPTPTLNIIVQGFTTVAGATVTFSGAIAEQLN